MNFRNFIRQRKVLITLIAALSALLVVLLSVLLWLERSGGSPPSGTMQSSGTTSAQPDQSTPGGQTTPSGSENLPSVETPPSGGTGPAASDPEQATPPADDRPSSNPGTSTTPPKTDADTPTETRPDSREDTVLLTCDQYSLFSGQFVEDGRDELVTNVAAILVTNQSDRFLDLATITFDIDGKEATFQVSGLPAGRSAWVLEANRMTATNTSVFTYVDMITGFRENVISSTDKITITCDGNMLTAKNNTTEKLENVFVYYRVLHSDGNYFGGITYVIDFGTLAPGASAEKLAGHFSAENARIVRVGWSGQ